MNAGFSLTFTVVQASHPAVVSLTLLHNVPLTSPISDISVGLFLGSVTPANYPRGALLPRMLGDVS